MLIDSNLEPIYHLITQASVAEDIFKCTDLNLPSDMLQKEVEKRYNTLLKVINPDSYQSVINSEAAIDVRDQLNSFYDLAKISIENGIYGINNIKKNIHLDHKTFQVGNRKYYIGQKLKESDLFTFYNGYLDLGEIYGEIIIKLVNNSKDNQLIQNEIRILDYLYSKPVPQRKHLPVFLNHFEVGTKKGIILRKISGYNFREISKYYPQGIDQKHMIWMLDRLLSLFGYIHSQGIIHGHLSPSHTIIRPNNHNAFILGWGNAMFHNELKGRKFNSESIFMAPELKNGGVIGPWSDIYSIGKLMIFILNGNLETNELPNSVEPKICKLLQSMVQLNPQNRPQDAWDLHEQQTIIKDSLWERKFLNFVIN
jgi:serine/threonine protein kinase